MKITLSNHEQLALLLAFTSSRADDGAARSEVIDLAKKTGLRDRVMDLHYTGKLEMNRDEVAAIPAVNAEMSKPEIRKLIAFLDRVPSSGTGSFMLHDLTERLQSELSRNEPIAELATA